MRTLYKPAGLPVMPPHGDPAGDCVLARLLADDPARAATDWPVGFEAGIAHRLDNATSGALAVADDLRELEALRAAFGGHHLSKTYRFLTWASVPWDQNRCDRPIAHARRHRGRMVVQRGAATPHRGAWMPAATTFRHREGPLWEATMRTGVMHQIRAHAAFVGLPLAGDPHYGRGPTPPDGHSFCLHHVGFTGPFVTEPVPAPSWAAGA